ncbi:cytochrome P450 [Marasmius fiardii PR-910]|nr:cytochrome P450 [Marasmius fiardii PR-910]
MLAFNLIPSVSPLFIFATSVGLLGGFIILTVLFFFTVTALKAHREQSILPKGLPFLGKRSEWFASVRANARGASDSFKLFTEAYEKYSVKGLVSVVPTWTKGPQVLVPPALINWLAHEPEHVMNARDCTFENMQFAYTTAHPEIMKNDMLDLMIKRELTRHVGNLNDKIVNEITLAMGEMFGTGDLSENGQGEWREVGIWDSSMRLVVKAANSVFVGSELCRNEEYTQACMSWVWDVAASSAMMHMFPKFLKPHVSKLVTYKNRRDARISMKHTLPLVEERIANLTRAQNDKTFEYDAPNDLITWMVKESFKRTSESETSAHSIAYRILLLNFAAVITSTIASANFILDIMSTDPSVNAIELLREEVKRVHKEHDGVWSKAAVAKLVRLDSALRESGRYSCVGGSAITRRVWTDDGIVLPTNGKEGEGLWVPKGATVGVAQHQIHFDEQYYGPTAAEFDPFRFSRPKEQGLSATNEDMVTTSSHYLTFSHGVHSCPGRFFAANELKLIMANLLLNYEIQPMPTRPPNEQLGDVKIPARKQTMMIRRRARVMDV